jgi:fatty acid desaturase
LVNQLRTLFGYLRERLFGGVLRLPPGKVYPELVLQIAVFWGAFAALAWADPTLGLRLAVCWFVPLLTLTQGIQKVRSFAEHAALDAPELSYSWEPGWFGRLVLWPYNIQYHREHHTKPSIPWFELPAAFPDREARPGRTLLRILWDGTF